MIVEAKPRSDQHHHQHNVNTSSNISGNSSFDVGSDLEISSNTYQVQPNYNNAIETQPRFGNANAIGDHDDWSQYLSQGMPSGFSNYGSPYGSYLTQQNVSLYISL